MIIEMFGTVSSIQVSIDRAIASACPLSSAPTPGYAPGVSIKEITGILNFSANFINLTFFRYPSGLIIPKFLSILVSRSSPFSWPSINTDFPSNLAKPEIKDLSSP